MTVSTTHSTEDFTAAGGIADFPFTFRCDEVAWVQVLVGGLLTESGFEVVLNADQDMSPGGVVTFDAEPDAGTAITIRRWLPYEQRTDFRPLEAFRAQSVEQGLDELEMQIQQIKDQTPYLEVLAASLIYDFACFANDTLQASGVLGRWTVGRSVGVPADFVGSKASSGVAATAEAVLNVKHNGSLVGTITFAAAGTVGVFSGPGFTTAPGDILVVEGPASPDATLAQISLTLVGTRSA